jgi:spermidine synthase
VTGEVARTLAVVAALLLSGAAALVYEIAWIRRASLAFGSTLYAVSSVVAVFLLGLALGSEIFGRVSLRARRPLALAAALEAAVALLVLASPAAFDLADAAYGVVYRAAAQPLGLHVVRFGLLALVLLPPTLLLGGTLPLACRAVVSTPARIGGAVGALYAANTLGAAVGCFLAGLAAIPWLGLRGSVWLGAGLSTLAALGFAASGRVAKPEALRAPAPHAAPSAATRLVPLLFFGTGAAALGYEVLWSRFLALVVPNTVHTYTLALGVVLVGIVLGSLLASAAADRVRARPLLFGAGAALAGLAGLAVMLLPPRAWGALGGDLAAYALLLLPTAALSGALLPLAVRMVVSDPALAGAGTGRLLALNTLGGIAGSLLVGWVLLPRVGLFASLLTVSGTSLACGVAACVALERSRAARALAAVALAVWLALPFATGTRLPDDFLAGPGETLVAAYEGRLGNLAVLRSGGATTLEIDRWWQGSDRRSHQALAAHVPMLLHADPKAVLVVGAGTGQTAARFLAHPIERLDCADLEPAVFDVIRAHFDAAWMDDPRVRLLAEDGRSWLAHADARYDVVSLELGQIARPGVAGVYTLEFYARARDRLRPGGLVSQFVQLPFLRTEDLRRLVATFVAVFPRAVLWYNTSELLLVGGESAALAFDPARVARVASDLDFRYWGGAERSLADPSVFLAGFLLGPRGLAALSAGAPPLRDDRPDLEYAAAAVDYRTATLEIAAVDLLRAHLESVEDALGVSLAPAERERVERTREGNLGDVAAQAWLRRAHASALPAEVDAALHAAVAANPENAAARRELARLLHAGTRLDEALPQYRAALALSPDDADLHNDFGVALAQRGDLAAARDAFATALRVHPEHPSARGNLAQTERALRGD